MSTTPGRVMKGKRMAGRMGSETTTIKNLEILSVTNDGVLIKGLLPGPTRNLLILRSAQALPEPEEEVVEEVPTEVVEEVKNQDAPVEEVAVEETTQEEVPSEAVSEEVAVEETQEEPEKEEVKETA